MLQTVTKWKTINLNICYQVLHYTVTCCRNNWQCYKLLRSAKQQIMTYVTKCYITLLKIVILLHNCRNVTKCYMTLKGLPLLSCYMLLLWLHIPLRKKYVLRH